MAEIRPLLLLVSLGACDAPEPQAQVPCPTMPLAAGAVWVGPLVCSDQRFSTGEGRGEDFWMANSQFRAVIRHPQASLTLAGLGGGTVIDAAPWGRADELAEVVPLVEGGWLLADDAAWDDRSITVRGEIRSLPYRPIPGDGQRREVTWSIEPDSPWLHLAGAEGMWLHPDDDLDLLDGWLATERMVYGHDGVIAEDLGGALRIDGGSGLLVALAEDAWAWRPGPHVVVSGSSEAADEIRVFRGDTWIARIPLIDGSFTSVVPADADTLQAVASGRAPSERMPIGTTPIEPGPGGSIQVNLGWTGRPRPVDVSWTTPTGRQAHALLPPPGGRLPLGAGAWDLTLSAGPAWLSRRLHVEVPGGTVPINTHMVAAFDPGERVLADLAWPGNRSRSVRDSTNDRLQSAIGAGFGWVVVTGEDAVARAGVWVDDAPWISFETAATLTSAEGWQITAWPWKDQPRMAGGGVPAMTGLGPERALGLAWGGPGTDRHLRVNLDWLRATTDPPYAVDPRPTHVALGRPGQPPFGAWGPWFAWLEEGRYLLPSGPSHWLDVEHASRFGKAEIGRAINLGRYCTGTGALLDLHIDGVGPGGLLVPAASPPPADTDSPAESTTPPADSAAPHALPTATVTLLTGEQDLDHVGLFVGGRGLVATWDVGPEPFSVSLPVDVPLWTLAIAWADTSEDWAVTSPIWATAPADLPASSDEGAPPARLR